MQRDQAILFRLKQDQLTQAWLRSVLSIVKEVDLWPSVGSCSQLPIQTGHEEPCVLVFLFLHPMKVVPAAYLSCGSDTGADSFGTQSRR